MVQAALRAGHIQRSAPALPGATPSPPPGASTPVEDVVAAAARGDRRAWNEIVRRYSGLVWAVARSHQLTSADSADVAQTTWLRLVEHIEDLKDPARVGSWLATTARRECLQVLGHTARCRPTDEVPEPAGEERPPVEARLLTAERDAALWRAFSRLAPSDQVLLRLLSAEPPASYKDIAAALDMPIGSIGPTRSRCLERLRSEVERLPEAPAI
jgi:RNA polymerase sigma factor (sigma-70 family)